MQPEAILLRHGESHWCRENRICGWSDIELSELGIVQTIYAARRLARLHDKIDIVFTSVLRSSIRTAWIVLQELDALWVPIEKNWRLNERHYGALQGLDPSVVVRDYGDEQFHLWCRSFRIRPPILSHNDPRHPRFDARYRAIGPSQLPISESLEDCLHRILPFWTQFIVPHLRKGERILLISHGDSLRALSKYLEHLSDSEVEKRIFPHAVPVLYRFNEQMELVSRDILQNEATHGDRRLELSCDDILQ